MTDRAIVVVDLGVGNLRSVERAICHALGDHRPEVVVTRDAGRVSEASVLVMPGQGAFGDCADALARDNAALARAVKAHIAADRPYLGICLGLQVLFEGSDEAPDRKGLGIFEGKVRRLRDGVTSPEGFVAKIPHVGWNQVEVSTENPAALRWLPPPPAESFYFVHSYHVVPTDASVVAATSVHGDLFVCAVARGNLLGVQFHPEKSQAAGIQLLRRFFTGVIPCG